ncbi:ABC transporter permease [Aquipuribacter sp. MA13-6]|uniref:ABC transporter permease n=1 Tax=unclassified Aquipuribacter TaxID=2635084 RepID=UPI003EEAA4B6
MAADTTTAHAGGPAPDTTRPGRGGLREFLVGPTGASLTAFVVFLLGWVLLGLLSRTFPGPLEVVAAMVAETVDGQVAANFLISMQRFGIGMLLSVVIGVVLGLAIGTSRIAADVLGDINLTGLAIPAVIWALLCVMWFGFGNTAPIVTVVLSAVPFVAVNVAAGAAAIPKDLTEMSASFGVGRRRRTRHVVLPAVSAYVFNGIRFAVMSGWNGLLLSEWFGASEGVGFRARYWYDASRMPGFLAWVVLFIVFMLVLDRFVLERISRRAFAWRDSADLPAQRAAA